MYKTLIKDCSVTGYPPELADIDPSNIVVNALIEWEFASKWDTGIQGLRFYPWLCGVKFFINWDKEQLNASIDHNWKAEFKPQFNKDNTFYPYICIVDFQEKRIQIF